MTSEPTAELREQFCRIYDQKLWGHGSGVGSSPENTVEYRTFLRQFMRCNHIRSVVGLGCGEWQFSRYVDWSGVTFVGVQKNIQIFIDHKRRRAGTSPKHRHSGRCGNPLPPPETIKSLLIYRIGR